MHSRQRSAPWEAILLLTAAGCTSPGASPGGRDASDDGSAWMADAAPAVYDGGEPVMIGQADAAAAPPPVCTPGPRATTTSFCGAPAATAKCPSCAPTAYACEAGAAPSEVIVGGGSCYTVGGASCCTIAECTQTTALNDGCADGGLAYYCPAGASGGPLGLKCATPDASAPSFACCSF